jgi:hypothetical protein
MGMAAYFTPVAAEKLDELKADPSRMESFLFPDEDDGDEDPEGSVDLDKAWHGIHFVLCALAKDDHAPLAAAVLGGEELGEDAGYGPPRVLDPSEVQEVASALEAVSIEMFEASFDPHAMAAAEIYPNIWERDGKEALDYLTHFFPTLVSFYREAASRGSGAVLWLA